MIHSLIVTNQETQILQKQMDLTKIEQSQPIHSVVQIQIFSLKASTNFEGMWNNLQQGWGSHPNYEQSNILFAHKSLIDLRIISLIKLKMFLIVLLCDKTKMNFLW